MSDKTRLENNNLELMNIYNAVENLPSAGGDVKLYDSIANMNLDHNVDDGQLAMVGVDTYERINTLSLPVTEAYLPLQVTLDFTANELIQLWGGPTSGRGCHLRIDLDASHCDVVNHKTKEYYGQYTSEDGIHYTLLSEEPIRINLAPR